MKVEKYTTPFIVALIQGRERIKEQRFYKSDLSASDMLLDLELIVELANLTEKQSYILEKYWVEGYTQSQVAEGLGITQQMVEKQTRAIKKKITRVLEEWGEI